MLGQLLHAYMDTFHMQWFFVFMENGKPVPEKSDKKILPLYYWIIKNA